MSSSTQVIKRTHLRKSYLFLQFVEILLALDQAPTCEDNWSQRQENLNTTIIKTQVFVFLDTYWPYLQVVDYVNFVLQRLNVDLYASSVTLLAASTGEVIVNTTHYLNDIYENWNITSHSWYRTGFNLPVILGKLRELTAYLMDAERDNLSMSGQSLIALMVPSPVAYVTDQDTEYCMRTLNYFNSTLPDLHFIYYAGGAIIRFKYFVWNVYDDLYPLSPNILGVERAAEPVIKRIRRVPRRIVNPHCGSNWWATSWSPTQIMQTINLGGINFYRIASNYLPGRQPMRFLQLQPKSGITFTLCTSRTVQLPYRNGTYTPDGVECGQAAMGAFSLDLTDACTDYNSVVDCPPVYFSVQAQTFADITQVSCVSPGCQSPDQAQYFLVANNFGCNSNKGHFLQPLKRKFILSLVLISAVLFK